MKIDIIFGRVFSYEKDGNTYYCVEYMTADNGSIHRDTISQKLFSHFKSLGLNAGDIYDGIFDVDSFNKITLIDINLA